MTTEENLATTNLTTIAMDVDSVENPVDTVSTEKVVKYEPLKDASLTEAGQIFRVPIPQNRVTPLRTCWMRIYTPLVQQMKLQVRYNPKTRSVEMRTNPQIIYTGEGSALHRSAEFVRAFTLGFEVEDAMVLLRLDDIYIDSFEIKDVKTLNGDHLSRAIGRIAGRGGKTKNTIENSSRTRIVLADTQIHILGSYRNIRVAKDAIVSLILGSTPGTVHTRLRSVASRLAERSRF